MSGEVRCYDDIESKPARSLELKGHPWDILEKAVGQESSKNDIKEMLDEGVIEPSESSFNSAITLAPKKDKT
ncbi:hypothetical protein PR048_025050 [Dryococelus australis]|uniref:Uncharacterized protein n=1 Tax=Dryococelus australis TaxID=614101 RepID=A0ABQ9GQE2_9NEOP|nr:hypothetical protein PR048_025050 [Dryococelus australis]